EEDLREVAVAGHLPEWPHLDARARHVEQEVADALVLRHVPVGAGEQHAPARPVRRRRPDLLAGDDPLVAVPHRPGREAREVRPGARLAEELAPHLVAPEHRSQEPLTLLLGPVDQDRGPGHADRHHERAVRHAEAGLLLVEDHLLDRSATSAAVRLGPGDPRPPTVVEATLPGPGPLDEGLLVVGVAPQPEGEVVGMALRDRVGLQPGTGLGPEGRLLRGVVDVHGRTVEHVLGPWRPEPVGGAGPACDAAPVPDAGDDPSPRAGPYRGGPPAGALRVVAPSLRRLGWREALRGVEIVVTLAVHLLRALVRDAVRHPARVVAALRRDPAARAAVGSALSVALV